MKNLIILFTILITTGCYNDTNSKEFKEVISFMIDKQAIPIPPPPAIDDLTTTTVSKKIIDSLDKIKLKVAIYPTIDTFSEEEFKKIPEEYLDKFQIHGNSQKRLTLNGISSRKGHKIVLADTIKLKKHMDFKDYDFLFWFSDFYFSDDNKKVLFNLGLSRSRLAGNSTLYILKKENNQWEIEYSRYISEW
jgi:hypothetical protein|tara:strand:- start:18 stop:590 length:573 start_codon:yes stop_codon:yes gene_type:complete